MTKCWFTDRVFINHLTIVFALLILSASGCNLFSKKSKNNNIASIATLTMSGQALEQDGSAGKGVAVYAQGIADPLGTTDASGQFSVTIDNSHLTALQSQLQGLLGQGFDGTFQLYLEENAASGKMMGHSAPIGFSAGATSSVGIITMGKPANIHGVVKIKNPAGEKETAASITVITDRGTTTSDNMGNFTLTAMPGGLLKVFMVSSDMAISHTELVVIPGKDTTLDYPLLVLPKDSVAGILVAIPQDQSTRPLIPGQPFRRDFKVISSVDAKFVRCHHQHDQLDAAPWTDINGDISYNFPDAGTYTLYYQFADANKAKITDPSSANVSTDPFFQSGGFVIEDGSGVVTSRKITVHVTAPDAATMMRYSENIADLSTSSTMAFSNVTNDFPFLFSIKSDPTSINDTMLENNFRDLYYQFKTADGVISAVYKTSVRIAPFADNLVDKDVFTLGDGSDTIFGLIEKIKVKPPQNAVEMRIYEEDVIATNYLGGGVVLTGARMQYTNTFIGVQSEVNFVFLKSGFKTVFLQFRDKDGFTSRVFQQTATVKEFDDAKIVVQINGGASVTNSRGVMVTFQVPKNVGVSSYRLSEEIATLVTQPMIRFDPANPSTPFLLGGVGLRKIFVQFGDAMDNVGSTITALILYDPFSGDPGAFIINSGEAVTAIPAINLSINPPAVATQMEVTEALKPDAGAVSSCGIVPEATVATPPVPPPDQFEAVSNIQILTLHEIGSHTICVRFRNIYGETSGYLAQSIIYDPFPIDLGGIEINDGAVSAKSRDVQLNILIPPRARQMRLASSSDDIDSAPFIALSPEVDWTLTAGTGNGNKYFAFVQFETENAELSTIYSASITLDLFPIDKLNLVINNGDTSTNATTLNLTLTPPEAAVWMQIAESPAGLANALLTPVSATTTYTLGGSPVSTGLKTIFIRYVSLNNEQSPYFYNSITYQ